MSRSAEMNSCNSMAGSVAIGFNVTLDVHCTVTALEIRQPTYPVMWYKCVGEYKEEKDTVINLGMEDYSPFGMWMCVIFMWITNWWFLCRIRWREHFAAASYPAQRAISWTVTNDFNAVKEILWFLKDAKRIQTAIIEISYTKIIKS